MSGRRFRVEPRDVPPDAAARRLGLTEAAFRERLPELLDRGFPGPDETTGMFDLDAIDRWRHLRHARLFPELTVSTRARDAGMLLRARLETIGNG